jgi:SAM-dependent methyltransferase
MVFPQDSSPVSHCINKSRNTMKFKKIRVPSPHPRQQFMEWYDSTSLGQTLRDSESSYLLNTLHHTYYQRILQVGRLGMETDYIAEEFMRNFCLIEEKPAGDSSTVNTVQAKIDEWPIACESVDTLILPHLIEFVAEPQRILSEAERVLKPEGRLFILGFNPWSLRGLLHFRQSSPSSWNQHCVGSSQVMDWLNLLKFETEINAGFGLPSSHVFLEPQSTWEKSIAYLTPVYAIKAIKRTWTFIPMKQSWVSAPGLVPGSAMSPPLLRKPQ